MLCGKSCSLCRRHYPKKVSGPETCAEQEQQPRDLEVGECGEHLEESTLLGKGNVEIPSDVLVGSIRPEHTQASVGSWAVAGPNPHRGEVWLSWQPGRHCATLPHTGFAGIELDVRACEDVCSSLEYRAATLS